MACSRQSPAHLASIFLLAVLAACGGHLEEGMSEGGSGAGGTAGAASSDASGLKDGIGSDAQGDGIATNDVNQPPRLDVSGTGGGAGSGGAAGSRADVGPGSGGASGSGGNAGRSGAAGTGGSSGTDGKAGNGGAPEGGTLPDASTDTVEDRPSGPGVDVASDAPIVCDKPPATGGVFDDATIWQLAGVSRITSSLTLSLTTTADLSVLTCLKQVDGLLQVQGNLSLVTASLPQLQTVSDGVRFDTGWVLKTIALPVLASAGQSSGISIGIDYLASLESISAPMLASTPGGIAIRGNGSEPLAGPLKIELGPITSASSLEIANNHHLQNIDAFSGLASVTWNVAIYGNEPLVAVSFPHLTSVGGAFRVEDQANVVNIALPELTMIGQSVGNSLEFGTSGRVTSISVPKLASTPAGVTFYQVGSARLPAVDPLVLDFRSLGSIGGPLDLNDLPSLVTLDGFPRLANIGGNFRLAELWSLQGLPFPALATVTGNVVMEHLETATEITLPALSRVDGGLLFDNNLALTAIGLPLLATVGQDPNYSITCAVLPVLRSFAAPSLVSTTATIFISGPGADLPSSATTTLDFASLKTIGGSLSLNSMPRLTSVTGFSALTSVQGDIEVLSDSGLATVAFSKLTSVSGSMQFGFDDLLSSIALPMLASIGMGGGQGWSMSFASLPVLTSIAVPRLASMPSLFSIGDIGAQTNGSAPLVVDFGALSQVGEGVDIYRTSLHDFSGFARLATIGGSLAVYENSGLASLALPALASVGGDVQVSASDALASIALPALTTVGLNGNNSIFFSGLPILSSISLPRLATTLASLEFSSSGEANPPSSSLTIDVGALASVGGTLNVQQLRYLQRLTFPQLASVNGEVAIMNNGALSELIAPTSPVIVGQQVNISGNASLPTCSAKAFAMSCTATGGVTVLGNKVDACGG
jgi:hypothetical protein